MCRTASAFVGAPAQLNSRMTTAAAQGWRPSDFGPISIDRTEETNGPTKEFFDPAQRAPQPAIGSRFEWPRENSDLPTVAGVKADIAGRWPLFHISPDLPRGLALDHYTGLISGKPEEEAEGNWLLTVSNPAGETSVNLRMRVMRPPHDLEYEYDEKVIIRGEDAGINSCSVSGSRPMRFLADGLPKGLDMYEDGTIRGVPDQLDADFVSYRIWAANDVGETFCKIKLLVSMPPTTAGHAAGICLINKDCEARVGQRVRATSEYILRRSHLGLEDVSAAEPRDASDCKRYGCRARACTANGGPKPSPCPPLSLFLPRPSLCVCSVVSLSVSPLCTRARE